MLNQWLTSQPNSVDISVQVDELKYQNSNVKMENGQHSHETKNIVNPCQGWYIPTNDFKSDKPARKKLITRGSNISIVIRYLVMNFNLKPFLIKEIRNKETSLSYLIIYKY